MHSFSSGADTALAIISVRRDASAQGRGRDERDDGQSVTRTDELWSVNDIYFIPGPRLGHWGISVVSGKWICEVSLPLHLQNA